MSEQSMKLLFIVLGITDLQAPYTVGAEARLRAKPDLVQKNLKRQLETRLYSERHLDQSSVEDDWRRRHHFIATEDGKTCVVIEAAILLDIQHPADEKKRVSTYHISDEFSTSGTCSNSNGTNSITIRFFGTWSLTIYIGRTTSHGYEWTRVELLLLLDEDRSKLDKEVYINRNLTGGTFEVTKNYRSLYCKGPVPIQMNDNVLLTFMDIQYRAFGDDLIDSISDQDVQKCGPRRVKRNDDRSQNNTNDDSGSTVTIALSASGGLVSFIILLCVLYFCCK